MRRVAAALLAVLLLGAGPAGAADDPATPVDLRARVLPSFRIGHPETVRFGRLDFVGGIEVESSFREVGGLSGLVVDPGGSGFIAITDNGLMLRAAVDRDGEGRPIGLSDGRLKRIRGLNGGEKAFRWDADTEGFDITQRDGKAIAGISFEGTPRVMLGAMEDDGFVGPLKPIALPPGARRLRNTKGLETMAFGPVGSRFEGAEVILAERAPRDSSADDRPGWVVGGSAPAAFFLKAVGDYDATDAKFGPDGDLYVLERLYSLAEGVRTRIRRLPQAEIVDGATVEGETIFEASLADQIDNMEGLSFWTRGDGATMISLISDDNRSFLQRTLYLEFRLAE